MSFQQCSRLLLAQGCKKPIQPSPLKVNNNILSTSSSRSNSTNCNTNSCQHRFLPRKDTPSSSSIVGIRHQMNGDSDGNSSFTSACTVSRVRSVRSLSTLAAATVAGGSSTTPPISSVVWGSLLAGLALVSSSGLFENDEDDSVDEKDSATSVATNNGKKVSSMMAPLVHDTATSISTNNKTTTKKTIKVSTGEKAKKEKCVPVESGQDVYATAAVGRRKQPFDVSAYRCKFTLDARNSRFQFKLN